MKPGFKDFFAYTKSADGHNFELVEPLTYVAASGEIIVVPVGSKTDGASAPRLLWRVIPPFGTYWPAAILHDFLYRFTKKTKRECDDLFLEAMLSLGVDRLTAEAIYRGVRLGGQDAFDEDRAQQAA